MLDGHLRAFVAEGMDEDRHVERSPAQGIGDGALVAEVRERYHHAINGIVPRAKEVGAGPRIGQTLDRAVRRRLRVECDRPETFLRDHLQDLFPAGGAEVGGKEAAIPHDHAKGRRFFSHGGPSRYHGGVPAESGAVNVTGRKT